MSDYDNIFILEPKLVFQSFCQISSVPRVPGKQKQISDYVFQYVKQLGLDAVQDKQLNVIARKPASPGCEAAPPVMVQAHLDMVCEKTPDSDHNFDTDPISLRLSGDKISADGTSLGADNGVGAAFLMALLADSDLVHPELEIVFTTDEETDMSGARFLDCRQIKSRMIINLDAPPVGVCGSGELEALIRLKKRTSPMQAGKKIFQLAVSGLLGGHSGQNAMSERGNAIVLLNRVLIDLGQILSYDIVSMDGGAGMSSAFARNASCKLALPEDTFLKAKARVDVFAKELQKEYTERDPGLAITFEPLEQSDGYAYTSDTSDTIKHLIGLLPDGIFSINQEFKGAMESCCNLGSLKEREKELELAVLIRSISPGKKYYLLEKIKLLCNLLGPQLEVTRDIPHWEYHVDKYTEELIQQVYPDSPMLVSQGTLECGVFSQALPDACVLSLGPPYYNAHSPSEYFLVSETQATWSKLADFLAHLGRVIPDS